MCVYVFSYLVNKLDIRWLYPSPIKKKNTKKQLHYCITHRTLNIVRQICKIPSTTHSNLLPSLNKSLPIKFSMKKSCAKYISSCLNNYRLIVGIFNDC